MNGARNRETKSKSRKAERPRSPHQKVLNFPAQLHINFFTGKWLIPPISLWVSGCQQLGLGGPTAPHGLIEVDQCLEEDRMVLDIGEFHVEESRSASGTSM
jgi:hypothetical protein